MKHPVMLVILDGWGWREEAADNAVRQAATPTFDRLWAAAPPAFLRTSSGDVGLPAGQMGNSEVGHLNIGAGRVVLQDLPRIGVAIEDGSLARNPRLLGFIETLKASGGMCHLMGLISPGGVHAHQDHAVALAAMLTDAGVPTVVHCFVDGRDTPPRSAAEYMTKFEADLPAPVKVATVIGRYFAMDRDKRWDRVGRAYAAMVDATGDRFADPAAAIAASYAADVTDEFVPPAAIGDYGGMRDGDGVLCFNFRADRVREILMALLDPGFDGFARARVPAFAAALGMTRYSDDLAPLMPALFAPQSMDQLLGQVVAASGRTQLRMAETEKYPHVTYFLNGGIEVPNPGEDRVMVPSPKVATYDLQPEMSAPELTSKAVAAIEGGTYDLIILNFANPDMVGHTGSLPAAIKAVETVDAGLGRIVAAIEAAGGALLVTADHGNCEMMRDPETGGPHTAHTTNPVPVMLTGPRAAGATLSDGRLADIAPTLLALMGLAQPSEMTGHSLLRGMRHAQRFRFFARRLLPAGGALAVLLAAGPASSRSALLDPVALRDQLLATEREHAAQIEAQRGATERARGAAAEAQRLADQRVSAAAQARAADIAVADAADRIADLARRRDEAAARLQARAADLAPLLPLIERLSLYPTETLLALPEAPEDALRGAMVLRGLAGTLEQEARGLRAEQASIARLSDEITAQLPSLQQAQAAQAAQAQALDQQIAAARATGRAAEDEAAAVARKAAAEAAHAVTLRGALSELEAQQQAALAAAREEAARAARARQPSAAEQAQRQQEALARPAGPGLSEAGSGALRVAGAPVAGRLLRGFGDRTAAGAAQGVSYESAPAARVTAPCAGRAVFAGPFRSFGLLLILDCGGGYHFVLAGLERLDVEVGHPVQAGEPIGVMPGWDPSGSSPRPALYVELRRGAQPIDPAPWLRGRG